MVWETFNDNSIASPLGAAEKGGAEGEEGKEGKEEKEGKEGKASEYWYRILLRGPPGTPYEGGIFTIAVEVRIKLIPKNEL